MSWRSLPDLAVRTLGGSVVDASDDLFAEKENLVKAAPPEFRPHTYGLRGQVMDGWETRRRREPGHDWAVVRLGLPGLVRGVVVDTAWFTGNHPQECAVDAGYADPLGGGAAEAVDWVEIVPRSPVAGDRENAFDVDHGGLVTCVRLRQYPDGGVARLRVHGEPVGDPRWLAGRPLDLAAMENGGRVSGCSDRFYSSPDNLLFPGRARVMGEGWETARRRDGGNDWVEVDLAAPGVVRQVEIDTSCFVGNAPGEASLTGLGPDRVNLLSRARLRADAVNRFLLAGGHEVSRLRLDIHPDGGLARLRVLGEPTPAGRAALFLRWYDRLPPWAAAGVLSGWGGADEAWALALAQGRPYREPARLPAVTDLPGTPPDAVAWSALTGGQGPAEPAG